ncbi:MAG: hypothetical protein KAQ79_13705 [Cyclobacteriaceae bacterium]|nr:hypothetical protein [Cyclobacteriaceae bacterium]
MTFEVEEETADGEPCMPGNRMVTFENIRTSQFNFHVGVLIFTPFLNKLTETGLGFIRQWLVSILLGCQNIEQNKKLNYSSLNQLIGSTPKTLRTQRSLLKDATTCHNTEQVLRFNADLVGADKQSDFYYDPHTKHYTGQLKTLSTWCPSVRLADKGINMDYIHTTSGQPVYFNTSDNFYDLRERFKPNIERFRTLCGFDQEKVLTIVVDRGIYSLDVFKDIINSPSLHIVTWQKGYENDKWDEGSGNQRGSIIRDKNKKGDLKLIHYGYQENTWDKEPAMRQIIVRVYDKKWDVQIELSIITDDKNRDAKEIINLMLKRWVQENDFKYMIRHFGLNQITTYAFTDYRALRDKIEDKIYICSRHKALTKEIGRVRAKLKTALLDKHIFDQKHGEMAQEKLPKKEQERKTRIDTKIKAFNKALEKLKKERSETPKLVSKLDELIDQDIVKLDTDTKSFMDAIKVLARNMFYMALQPFKEKYNNYRDDHALFRHLTLSGGTITKNNGEYKIMLQPQMEFQPKVKKIIGKLLDEINATRPQMPNGSRAKIELALKL